MLQNWVLCRFSFKLGTLKIDRFMLQNWVLWRFNFKLGTAEIHAPKLGTVVIHAPKLGTVEILAPRVKTGYCGESCSKTWYCGDSCAKTGYCGDLRMNTQSPSQKHLLLALSLPADRCERDLLAEPTLTEASFSPFSNQLRQSLLFPIFNQQ